ncbi:MAG: hypothetical protein MJ238_05095 [Bacilli bacterium]|nr:hypothetical protein [Bacilli bacterium]
MYRNKALAIIITSMLLTGCGSPTSSSFESSVVDSSSSNQPINSSVVSSTSMTHSSSSISSSSQELVEDDGVIDLSDIERAFRGNIGKDKTFTINQSREMSDSHLSSTKKGEETTEEIVEEAGEKSVEILSSDGENGVGFYSCISSIWNGSSKEDHQKLITVEKEDDQHVAYNGDSLISNIVDDEYLYFVLFEDSPVVELAAVEGLDVSYFKKFTVSPDYIKNAMGADAFQQLVLDNYFNIEFGSKDGVYWQSFICGTTTTFREPRIPSKPDGRKYITNASFDYRYSLAIEWNDEQLIGLSIDIWETSIKSVYDFSTTKTTERSYRNSYSASIDNRMTEIPSHDKTKFENQGIVDSKASFVIPLSSGEYEYRLIDGKMGDDVSNLDILSRSALESEIDVNVYEDIALKKKVDLSSLKLKSHAKTYYIDFTVPKRTSYVIMDTALRRKSEISKGDITFKSTRWTEIISGPLASWMPDDYVIIGYPDSTYFTTTELQVLASNDKNPTININKMSLKGGCYYVIRNCADEK